MKRFNVSTLLAVLFVSLSVFAQQELKICALRVSFQEDQNSLTTGNGLFMMDTSANEQYTIDPPPHNRSYFQDQIIAVKNYFLAASKGQLIVSGDVFPLAQNESYQLSQEMGYYNPNTTDEENDRQLAQLLVDAIQLADVDPDIDFSQYDIVTVFHAGVGKDIDVGFDETPQDIPSLYLSFDFLKQNIGTSFTGINVDNGNSTITNGIILPETESQVDYQLGITGIFASNIASHLGMYDLFSASEQATGIGQFGLMDVGQFNVRGLVPAIPTAFSRMLVGWDLPVEISAPQDSIQVNHFKGELTQNNSIIKIPINSDEYYLLEYRGERTINIDSVYVEILDIRNEEPTYLEVLDTYLPNNIKISDSTGVLLKVDDYDWGLPGSGVLIWHVDERVIAEKGPVNRINDDPENRGIDLEEADGSQDIGFSYDITQSGFQSELGTWLDFWFKMSEFRPLYKNSFSTTSSPNTRSNRNYANTHIVINNFSKNYGDVMTFDFSRDFFEEGFPIILNNNLNSEFGPLKAGNITNNVSALFTADNMGNIYAITGNGHGIFSDSLFNIARISVQEMPELALGDSNSDSLYDVLIASVQSGLISAFTLEDLNNDNFADTLFTTNIGTEIQSPPVIRGQNFYVSTTDERVLQFNFNGELISELSVPQIKSNFVVLSDLDDLIFSPTSIFGPIVVDVNSDGNNEQIFFPDSNKIQISFSQNESITESINQNIIACPAIADLDLDGYYEIVFHSENMIHAVNYNFSNVMNMPIKPVLFNNEKLTGTPLIADVDRDGLMDILSVTNQGQIFAYNSDGEPIDGFPASAGGIIKNSAALFDLDSDGNLELFSLDASGKINAWQFDEGFNANNLWWTQQSFSAENNLYIEKHLTPVISAQNNLLPENKVFNYPNPNIHDFTYIRYFLTDNSDVNIKIFDLAGDMVDSFKGPGNSDVDQQVKWNVADIESGVYLCRVEAKSEGKSQVRIIKIMVIH